jgi:hypothetical protein
MGPTSKWHFLPGIPKLGLPQLWGRIILCADFWLRWGLKQSCNPHQELFNNMSHATCTQGNWGDSWLLVVGSQIVSLTFDLSFGHNLCLRCPNGSFEPILDIYVPRAFQWYNEFINPMSFDLCNRSLKIWKSIVTPTPKVRVHLGVHLGVWRCNCHSPILSTSWEHEMWLRASLLARTFASPSFAHEPKARVATMNIFISPILHSPRICCLWCSSSQRKELSQLTPHWSIRPFSNWNVWMFTQIS